MVHYDVAKQGSKRGVPISQFVAACCSVLQCVAVCCSVLQRVAARCSVLQRVAVRGRGSVRAPCHMRECVLQRVAVCCSVLQCVAVCCSVQQVMLDYTLHNRTLEAV